MNSSSYLQHTLSLAERGLGNVWPNPAVGCVIIRDGQVVGTGWTQPGGRPHAETEALKQAGEAARGATVYVSLEPCAHHGKTPPCAEALIQAGIARCVVALQDPDTRTAGKGIARLREAGIEVELLPTDSEMAKQARWLNRGFFSRVERGRPWIAVKLAVSLDGRMALGNGASQWITGEQSRAYVHFLRATYDAVATGSGTVQADNPQLNCRLLGVKHQPQRVVIGRGNLPPESHLGQAGDAVWHLREPLNATGQVDLSQAMQQLGERGVTRLLVEAGPKLVTALLDAGLVDELLWFRAPLLMGADAKPAIEAQHLTAMADIQRWHLRESRRFGEDVLEVYTNPSSPEFA